MKTIFIVLILLLFSFNTHADIVDRVIYAGDTPLATDCRITQTGPMELTVEPCAFTTTGVARILGPIDSFVARTGIGSVAQALREGKAEWHRNRVRIWLQDRQGNIIERSVTYGLPVPSVITVPPGDEYYIHLEKVGGVIMKAVLVPNRHKMALATVHPLSSEITVPVGTTDLSAITVEVFTVRPDFPPAKGLFEK